MSYFENFLKANQAYVELHGDLHLPIKPKTRSEERRVGKECRSRWSPYH